MVSNYRAQLRDGIRDKIRAHFPADVVREVITHQGDFDADAVERYAVNCPALIVTLAGAKSKKRGGVIETVLRVNVFVLVKGKTDTDRTTRASVIIEHLERLIFEADWADAVPSKSPDDVEDTNLYSAPIDQAGLALWAVRWDQLFHVPPLTDPSDFDNFHRMWVDYVNPGTTEPVISDQLIDLENA